MDGRNRPTLDRYLLLHTLGKGMSGKVKLGRDIRDGTFVAIKIMYLDTMSVRAAQHLQREIKAMMSLQHPNIMQLRDVYPNLAYVKKNGQQRQVVALVLELAGAGELFEFVMHTGAFPEPVARTLFLQLCSAMAACHKIGIAHRDIKPENVLLDRRFQLKVADFGLASIMEEGGSGMCKTKCGTTSYMAPEVLAGSRSYDATKADVWSAGVVLFIMIAGNPPFEQAASSDWWYTACRCGRYDRFWAAHLRTCPDFPTQAQDLLNRIFVEDPARRPSFEQLMRHPWLAEGPIWDERRLEVELGQRLARVEAMRATQKQRKRAKGAVVDPFACNVVRSAGSPGEVETLFDAPGARLGLLISALPMDKLLAALAAALTSCVEDAHTVAGPPLDAVLDEASRTVELDKPRLTVKTESAKVKALYPRREVEVVAQAYAIDEGGEDPTIAVHLLRIQGDAWQYDAIRRAVVAALEKSGAIRSLNANDAAVQDSSDVFDEVLEGAMLPDAPEAAAIGAQCEEIELI